MTILFSVFILVAFVVFSVFFLDLHFRFFYSVLSGEPPKPSFYFPLQCWASFKSSRPLIFDPRLKYIPIYQRYNECRAVSDWVRRNEEALRRGSRPIPQHLCSYHYKCMSFIPVPTNRIPIYVELLPRVVL